jgi:hypothetical protein
MSSLKPVFVDNRAPWSLPTGRDLWNVATGVLIGLAMAGPLWAAHRNLMDVFLVALALAAILFVGWVLTNPIAWLFESRVRVHECDRRLRQLAEERIWLTAVGRAATNKRRHLAQAGYRRRITGSR